MQLNRRTVLKLIVASGSALWAACRPRAGTLIDESADVGLATSDSAAEEGSAAAGGSQTSAAAVEQVEPQVADVVEEVLAPSPPIWAELETGRIFYARALVNGEQPLSLYTQPDFNSRPIINTIVELARSHPIRIDERYAMNERAVVRIQKLDDDFGVVLKDLGVYSPYGDGREDVFVPLAEYQPIVNLDAITLSEGIGRRDKQFIILKAGRPEVLALEGDEIILRMPAVLGGLFGDTNTPSGDFRVSRVRGSRHMPGYPGVPFPLYFSQIRGYAIHSSYWWYWERIEEGFYGSGGCVNLPNMVWGSIQMDGEEMSASQFLYRWVATNLSFDEQIVDEVKIAYNDPGYQSAESTVRMVSVSDLRELFNYPTQGVMSDWQPVIEQYQAMGPQGWLLPSGTIVGAGLADAQQQETIVLQTDNQLPLAVADLREAALDGSIAVKHAAFAQASDDLFKRAGSRGSALVYDMAAAELLFAHNVEPIFPVASAFKGPLMLMFLDQINPSFWSDSHAYRWASLPTDDILRRVHDMVRKSDNTAAGNVLGYLHANAHGSLVGENALETFNNWLTDVVGLIYSDAEHSSGLASWSDGLGTIVTDLRYMQPDYNRFSAIDMAHIYAWATYGKLGYSIREKATEISGVLRDGNPSYTEQLTDDLRNELGPGYDVEVLGKDGWLGPATGALVTASPDAGMLRIARNGSLLLDLVITGLHVNVAWLFQNNTQPDDDLMGLLKQHILTLVG